MIREKLLENSFKAEFGDQIINIYSTKNVACAELSIKDDKIAIRCDAEGTHIDEYLSLIHNVIYIDDPNIANELSQSSARYFAGQESHEEYLLEVLQGNKEKAFSSVDEILIQKKLRVIEDKINAVCDGDISLTDSKGFQYVSSEFKEGLNIGNMATGLKSFAILKMLLKNGYLEENGFVIFAASGGAGGG